MANIACGHASTFMKIFFAAVAVVLFSGCESLPERVRERFAEAPAQVRTFKGEKRAVYHAAQTTFKELDWVVTHATVSPSRVEAASPINASRAFNDARQLVANLEFTDLGEGETQVSMRLTGQVESGGSGVRSQEALREHGFYERYFTALEGVLRNPSR